MAPPDWQITVLSGPEAGRRVVLSAGPVTLGRRADNTVCLAEDATVSARHATLSFDNGVWQLADAGSKNGTRVIQGAARVPVLASIPLAPGDRFYLGSAKLELTRITAPMTAGTGAPPALLRVDAGADGLRYHLASGAATGTRYHCPITPEALTAYTRRTDAAVMAAHHGDTGASKALDALADEFARHLFPVKLLARLAAIETDTLVISHLPGAFRVPWELLPVGGKPLSVRFALARQVLLDDQSVTLRPENSAPPRWLIVADPTGDLPEAQASAEAIHDRLLAARPTAELQFVAGTRVTRLDLLRRLEMADVVYYTGHARHAPGDPPASGWQLADGMLTARDFTRLGACPPVVIANACASSREAAHSANRLDPEGASGLAGALLLAGVSQYIGTQWPVTSLAAALLGGALMSALLDGQSMGVALRQARTLTRAAFPHDPAWAAYSLFGNPTQTRIV